MTESPLSDCSSTELSDEEVEGLNLVDWPIKDEYLIELGRVVSLWTSLEVTLDVCVAKLAGFDAQEDARGSILVRHASIPQKLDMVGALCELLSKEHEWLSEYPTAITKLRRAQKLRNELVHSGIVFLPNEDQPVTAKTSHRGKTKISIKRTSRAEIRRAAIAIDEASRSLWNLLFRKDYAPAWRSRSAD